MRKLKCICGAALVVLVAASCKSKSSAGADASTGNPAVSPFGFAPGTAPFTKDVSAEANGAVAQMHFEADDTKSHSLLTIVKDGHVLLSVESWNRADGSVLLRQEGLSPGPVQLWVTDKTSPFNGSLGGRALQPLNRQDAMAIVKASGLRYADGTRVSTSDPAPDPAAVQAVGAILQELARESAPRDGGAGASAGPPGDPPGYLPGVPPQGDPKVDAPCVACLSTAVANEISCAAAAAVAAQGCVGPGWTQAICLAIGELGCLVANGVAFGLCWVKPGPCCPVTCSDGTCCKTGTHCAGPAHAQFCCAGAACGAGCCEANDVCYQDQQVGTQLCCASGQVLCPPGAPAQTCCLTSETCNPLSGACCASGQQPCGNRCCPTGTCSGAANDPNAVCCPTTGGPGGPCNGVCCGGNQVCVNGVCQTSTLSCGGATIPCWDGRAGNNVVCCGAASCCGKCCEAPFQPQGFVCAQGVCLETPP